MKAMVAHCPRGQKAAVTHVSGRHYERFLNPPVHACNCQDGQTKTTIVDTSTALLAIRIAAAAAAACLVWSPAPRADAVLNSPNAQIARNPDAALRRSIPAFNDDVEAIQRNLESIQFKLRIPQRKPWNAMLNDLQTAQRIASEDSRMLRGVLPNDVEKGKVLTEDLRKELDRLAAAVAIKDPDRTSIRVANSLERVAALELLQAPGLPYPIPSQYASLPRLTGRAVVELVIEKANGSEAFVPMDGSEEGPSKRAKLEVTLDGFSAPITCGNFVRNVQAGVYDDLKLSVSRESILAGTQGTGVGSLPLEMRAVGDLEPLYRTQLDVLNGELPILPLSISGSVAMAHLPGFDSNNVGYVSAQQFFLHKFERSASGLAGLAYDEGTFGVFGFVTKGVELLNRIDDGDVLISAKVIAGAEKLVFPRTLTGGSNVSR
jgi:cyclophilin family peptidyl-prolyl cis-trans isomerase